MSGVLALGTGASRGIGQAIANRLSNDGYRGIGTATRDKGAETIRSEVQKIKPNSDAVGLNSADGEQTEAALKDVLERCGVPYVVVNNADITRDNLFLRMSEDEWNEVINTNLSGVYRVCKTMVKPMLKIRNGAIINISSIIGTLGNAGQANYAAAKAGLEAFSR